MRRLIFFRISSIEFSINFFFRFFFALVVVLRSMQQIPDAPHIHLFNGENVIQVLQVQCKTFEHLENEYRITDSIINMLQKSSQMNSDFCERLARWGLNLLIEYNRTHIFIYKTLHYFMEELCWLPITCRVFIFVEQHSNLLVGSVAQSTQSAYVIQTMYDSIIPI